MCFFIKHKYIVARLPKLNNNFVDFLEMHTHTYIQMPFRSKRSYQTSPRIEVKTCYMLQTEFNSNIYSWNSAFARSASSPLQRDITIKIQRHHDTRHSTTPKSKVMTVKILMKTKKCIRYFLCKFWHFSCLAFYFFPALDWRMRPAASIVFLVRLYCQILNSRHDLETCIWSR